MNVIDDCVHRFVERAALARSFFRPRGAVPFRLCWVFGRHTTFILITSPPKGKLPCLERHADQINCSGRREADDSLLIGIIPFPVALFFGLEATRNAERIRTGRCCRLTARANRLR